MIRGSVTRELDPLVTVNVANSSGVLQSLEVVLDTGFSEELALPYETIRRLGLTYRGQGPISLAIGEAMAN